MRTTGTVKFFNSAKGFGFITPSGALLFSFTAQKKSLARTVAWGLLVGPTTSL
jgi:cold-shock-like DNA binding protein